MMLNSFLQMLWRFMAHKKNQNGKSAVLDCLRVQLIPTTNNSFDFQYQKQSVQNLISLMVSNSHKKGRPKKNCDEADEVKYV